MSKFLQQSKVSERWMPWNRLPLRRHWPPLAKVYTAWRHVSATCPLNQFPVNAYAAECQSIAESLADKGVTCTEIIKGNHDLYRRGYGGINGVGNASFKFPPRIVNLEYTPPKNGNSSTPAAAAAAAAASSGDNSHDNDNRAVAFVTKCIFYDAGRLALMQQASPSSSGSSSNHRIKANIVGSVGVLGGFVSALNAGYQHTQNYSTRIPLLSPLVLSLYK
jgi:hypothetical protein